MPGVNFIAWDMASAAFGATISGGPGLNRGGRDKIVAGAGPDPDDASRIEIYRYDGSKLVR